MRIFIIGPGGVGKTTSGKILANKLGYEFVDLDSEFMVRVNNIGKHISEFGYKDYCYKNSGLFLQLLNENVHNTVIVLSSGFLVHEELEQLTKKHQEAMKSAGVSLRLLPSRSIDISTEIVIRRQLQRGFDLKEDQERKKFRHRFPIYKKLGDIKIYSYRSPEEIAEKMFAAVKPKYNIVDASQPN